ncbi:hypothetical protein [Mesorhizobium sp.]|uniref:hypothetical protein n=1 Tax=Mesorhizobium sp. TaxID=1871066 RepID=UPI000FE3417F|nr:hypothetical protein [Mesorhizobium sp.]RWN99363.1 MAG: hypothetical protein EOS06_18400 [Mesorhizobium sp.]
MHEHIKGIVEKRFLEVCTPEMAFAWLRDQPPVKDFYRHQYSRLGAADGQEKVLLDRQEALIDYGLARYGRSREVTEALYARLGQSDRCVMRACHVSGGGPETFNIGEEISSTVQGEMECWVTNPNIGDDAFLDLFNRQGVFEKATDEQWMQLLAWAGSNPRLATAYDDSGYLDGWDEYSYRKVFHQAWQLTEKVPATQEWAGTLNVLLQNLVPAAHDLDVAGVLERWRIDDPENESKPWHSQSRSWYLRTCIARLEEATSAQLSSGDAAVRASFYGRFDPHSFPKWQTFIDRDGEVFFQYAVMNNMLWRSWDDRQQLSEISWAVPDPRSNMDAPNLFRAVEQRMRAEHPDWFEERPEAPAKSGRKWF